MGNEMKLPLNLKIDGRKLPRLMIHPSEEEFYRAATKDIDRRIAEFRKHFGTDSDLSDWDILAMIAVDAVSQNYFLADKNNTKPFEDKIDSLLNELDNYLKK